MDSFTDKVAVITGAASGIGQALAVALDALDTRLVLIDVDNMDATMTLLRSVPEIHHLDVADAEAMETLVDTLFRNHTNIHLLFNNAGVMGPMAPLWEQQVDDWQWVFDVNVKGIANAIRAFVPRMIKQTDAAHIVNTASEASFAARAFVGVYHASKHAVLAITETLAQELAIVDDKIRVSALCPSAVNTGVMRAARNRPASLSRTAAENLTGQRLADVYHRSLDKGLAPAEVAQVVIEGLRNDLFYLLPHPEVAELPTRRADAVRNNTYPAFDPNLQKLVL